MASDLELLRSEVREAIAYLDVLQPPWKADNDCWTVARAELLRLARANAMLIETCSRTGVMNFKDRAEKAEAELARLKRRIDEAPERDADDLAHTGAAIPCEWRGERLRLLVDDAEGGK